ncbi:MAG: cupin domain-containing protein [Nitrososphaera sp.]|jgi:mannose-6-phosphate isomerase-like protein (cupin superfamily)
MKGEKGRTFDLYDLVSQIPKDSYWVDFLKVRRMEAGVLSLKPGEKDTQTPHDSDELYYVTQGSGVVKVGNEDMPVRAGSVIFIPAHVPHHFYGNKDTLTVLYVFSE